MKKLNRTLECELAGAATIHRLSGEYDFRQLSSMLGFFRGNERERGRSRLLLLLCKPVFTGFHDQCPRGRLVHRVDFDQLVHRQLG